MILDSSVDRFQLGRKQMNRNEIRYLSTHTIGVRRYEAYCMSLATHVGVASPRNGITIPRRRALTCAAMNTHYAPFN